MLDQYGRTIDYMRISVTDRCNLRCIYCMPPQGVPDIPHDEILTFEEITRVVQAAAALGIRKIKLTGGEPLVRNRIATLVAMLHAIDGIEEITMTTNGVLFSQLGPALVQAGLCGVNFSLDSLNPATFSHITRRDAFPQVMEGLRTALALPLKSIKVNCVPLGGLNTQDLADLAALAKDNPIDIRFIEMMPIGYGKQYTAIDNAQVYDFLETRFGKAKQSTVRHGNGPAVYYTPPGFQGSIGFISAMSDVFCENCNRVRLTADGVLKQCLHLGNGVNLKKMLRCGISGPVLQEILQNVIYHKPRQHRFLEGGQPDEVERRAMVQIGG